MATSSTSTDQTPSSNDEYQTAHLPLVTFSSACGSTVQRTISLYVLRQANVNDEWKIQALFIDRLKYEFSRGISLIRRDANKVSIPFYVGNRLVL